MATTYFSVVTDIGARKMLERTQQHEKLQITEFAVGDGGGQYYEPTTDMTALKKEVWRGSIHSCKISEESENILIVDSVIPADKGGFTIREMAIFDDEGDMIAICNTPDTAKVRVTDGVVHELMLSMEVLLTNTDSTELVVDPNVVTATKADVEALRKESNGLIAKLAERLRKLEDLVRRLFAFSYNDEQESIVVGNEETTYSNETIMLPDDLAAYTADDETITLSGGGGGGGGGVYILPTATESRLGGIKVGNGFTISEDGTLSIDEEQTAEAAASIVERNATEPTDAEVDALFN